VDFSKAFDSVPFATILSTISKFDVHPRIIRWLESYFHDRLQCVRTSSAQSSWTEVISGVPQGSVLGPLLFAVVIDKLQVVSSSSTIIKYADDVTILHFLRSHTPDTLPTEGLNIQQWAEATGLSVNVAKTKILNFASSATVTMSPLTASSGEEIECVTPRRDSWE
jgi:hypothetical protein